MSEQLLVELQATLEREIPISRSMGIRVYSHAACGLKMAAPLDPNRNHQQTAFAGTLNALCTLAGWGTVFLLAREQNRPGNIVIRRSAIKYLRPVTSELMIAHCAAPGSEQREHFIEMLNEKGSSKIDLDVEIIDRGQVAVSFRGSYVVLGENHGMPRGEF